MEDKSSSPAEPAGNGPRPAETPGIDKVLPKGIELTQLMQVAAMAQAKQEQLDRDINLIKHGLVALDDKLKKVIALLTLTK